MVASTPTDPRSLASASGLLLGTLVAAMGIGALIGWLVGAGALGLLVGAIVGIPLAVAVVYRVYSGR
jgi:F0F1-type ATP synthase assembly protein I